MEVPSSQQSLTKPRILTISKPYVAATYRDKLLAWTEEFEVGLICPSSWDGERFEPSAKDDKLAITQLRIRADGHNHFHIYRGLGRAIRNFAPDLLHIEEEHYSLVTWQALRHAKSMGIPATFYTWQNIDKRYPPPFRWIERDVFRHAYGIAGNREAAEILRRKGYSRDVPVIPQMGVDLDRYPASVELADAKQRAREQQNFGEEEFWLGFLGRLVPEKGLEVLLRALKQTPPNTKLLIVGSGPVDVRQLAQHCGVEDRVSLKERIPSVEVPAILLALDLLCLPSLTRPHWKEQFGRILIEAMAAGTACLGSDSGEIPHVIGHAGWVAAENDASAWSQTLVAITKDAAREKGRLGRSRVTQLYSNEKVAAQFAQVFRELLTPAN